MRMWARGVVPVAGMTTRPGGGPTLVLAMFGLVTAVFFGSQLLLALVPAGPDIPVPGELAGWVDMTRLYVQPRLGPFRLRNRDLPQPSAATTDDEPS